MSLTEDIAALINAEVTRVTADKDAKIADLKAKLQDSEARWEHLRDLLGATPRRPDLFPPPRSKQRSSGWCNDRDDQIAAFHAKREIGPCAIKELGRSLGVNESNASNIYSKWCTRTGIARINYRGNGQRVLSTASTTESAHNIPQTITVNPVQTTTQVKQRSDALIADFHNRRKTAFVTMFELAENLGINHTSAYAKYAQWCRKNGVERINYTSGGNRAG